jgi:hypothetical protein
MKPRVVGIAPLVETRSNSEFEVFLDDGCPIAMRRNIISMGLGRIGMDTSSDAVDTSGGPIGLEEKEMEEKAMIVTEEPNTRSDAEEGSELDTEEESESNTSPTEEQSELDTMSEDDELNEGLKKAK